MKALSFGTLIFQRLKILMLTALLTMPTKGYLAKMLM